MKINTVGSRLGRAAFAIGEWVQVGDWDPWVVRDILHYEPGLIIGGSPPRCTGEEWRPDQVDYPKDRSLWSDRQKIIQATT